MSAWILRGIGGRIRCFARRGSARNDAAQLAALTEDDRRELDATRLFDELLST